MNKKMLPDFYGILEVQHYIKGRIRLKVNSLIQDDEKAKELVGKLASLNGIEDISVNTLIGSVLIKFSEEVVDPITLIGAVLSILGLEEEVFDKKNGKLFSGMREVIESIDFAIYNKTKGILDLKSTIALLFIINGIRKIRQNPIMPNGVNLLWWGFNIISKGGN
ncbi:MULTISPECIES: HMA2 domain-containing protein [Fusobacterium]|jgi:hypothetical protein|uniref:Uncharacterized protein n=2 Tax=Fusobacterium mortiferum TaxID=850 RepID=A0A414PZ27_FUSMR|nr:MULTISPECIES: hypothetical protein [Fusobacterium]AVQ18529.1 hypothetical protein C4N19_05315 [Fusobacterium mortiferum ATCC 9817]EEO34768.1 hypothetical protein FMAG_00330 [Fusobacterium mortiferum ATCC 9817]MCF2699429.1 hypothetical protein [Fusobacterium mortiferum]MCI6383243.1 hypothetical protein [Fusobacterium mortiferum]MCI7187673.1 hypothetical protein [Fusobacterium mortiferum]